MWLHNIAWQSASDAYEKSAQPCVWYNQFKTNEYYRRTNERDNNKEKTYTTTIDWPNLMTEHGSMCHRLWIFVDNYTTLITIHYIPLFSRMTFISYCLYCARGRMNDAFGSAVICTYLSDVINLPMKNELPLRRNIL